MIERLAFAGIMLLGSIVALPKVPVYLYDVVAQVPTPTPVPPVVIPAWILGGGHFYLGQQGGSMPTPLFFDVDPGATPDQHLFAGVLDAGVTPDPNLGTNCPGLGAMGNVSKCNPYLYINMLDLLCDGTPLSSNAYNDMNGTDELAFLHLYAVSPGTPGPRLADAGNCPTSPPGTTAGFYMNPDDTTGFLSWLLTHAWTTTTFPAPFGIYEDHFAAVGGPCWDSYEYGQRACNVQGNSHGPDPNDWETALGDFETNAESNCATGTCFAFVGNGLTPGGGNNTAPCKTVSGSHCYATPEAGVVDDYDALDNLCSAADSSANLRGLTAEEIVFLKGPPVTSGPRTPAYANPQTIVYLINTMSHLVNYTSGGCENMVAIDIEAAGGSFYPLDFTTQGSVSGGLQVRMEATALRFLVPDPKTLIPDRMQPFYFTIGGTNNNWTPTSGSCTLAPGCEVPYMFEETLVPQGPEISVAPFSWNGSHVTVGDGCPAKNGDAGGAVDLMVTCVNDPLTPSDGAAVFLQEYHHLYINGHDYGPAAVLLNTASATSVAISSAWFSCTSCTPLSDFTERLNVTTGELTSVPYSGVTGGSISLPCTAVTYCNGDNTVTGNTSSFTGSYTIPPDSGVILLGSN
jgi:hypothetical protein